MSNKPNLSKTYLLPLIAPVIGIESKYLSLVQNTYLFFEEDISEGKFYVLQDFSFRNPDYTSYEHRLTNNQYFEKLIDFENKVLYVFNFPKEYLHEYNSFLMSKYSKFNNDAKEQILHYWTMILGKSTTGANTIFKIKQILYKEKSLKEQLEKDLRIKLSSDAELGELVKIDNEIFKSNEYKNKKIK